MPMPCPTGAPTRAGRPPLAWMAPSCLISNPMVRCECTTPFGSAVVPDVYAMRAGADGSVATGPSIGSAPARSSNGRVPADTRSPTTNTSRSPSRWGRNVSRLAR